MTHLDYLEQVSELRILLEDAEYPASDYDVFESACREFYNGDQQIQLESHYKEYVQSGNMKIPSFVGKHAREIRKGRKPLCCTKQNVLVA